jgi:DNA-binding NarL/FixJ family response regulator
MDTGTGAGVGNLFVVFLLQSNVLSLRRQFSLHVLCILAMTAITAINVPLSQIQLMPILMFITNGAIALIGRLIVGDDQTQIAETLILTEGPVKNHATATLSKLEVRDRTQAVLKVRTLRLV